MRMLWWPLGRPAGGTCNPPAPGWKPMSREERERYERISTKMFVEVVAYEHGEPSRVRAEDGFEFDPRPEMSSLVAPDWPYEQPLMWRHRVKGGRAWEHDLGDEDDYHRWWHGKGFERLLKTGSNR